jgi:hypothetical protein
MQSGQSLLEDVNTSVLAPPDSCHLGESDPLLRSPYGASAREAAEHRERVLGHLRQHGEKGCWRVVWVDDQAPARSWSLPRVPTSDAVAVLRAMRSAYAWVEPLAE